MKKSVFIIVLLLAALLLGGCKEEEQSSMEIKSNKTVTFVNELKEADVWILPQTEKNLKTTVWGTATAAKVKTAESVQAPLCEPGDDGLYIFRMIDSDSFFYSADGIALEDGWSIKIKEPDVMETELEVSDENGVLKNTYKVFSARL